MEVSFDVDIDLNEDNNRSNDDCELHSNSDYDNQKLFDIYESYLNQSDISDTDSEPELSLNDQLYQMVTNRVAKTPITNRSIGRISCFADIENQKSIQRKSLATAQECDQSLDESMSEVTLPWNLNDMNEQQIVALMNGLEQLLEDKEKTYPEMAANYMKTIFDKQMEFFKHLTEESENKFRNRLQEMDSKSAEEKVAFDALIGEQLKDLKSKSDQMSKLKFELNVIKDISNK